MKLNLDLFAKNYLHVGPVEYERHTYNAKDLYILKDKSTIINLKNSLNQYKLVLNLISTIVENKGTIFITHLAMHSSSFTNKEQRKDKLPSVAVFISNDNKDNIIACKKLGIPTVQMINNTSPKREYKATYTILSNSSIERAQKFHYSLLNYAIRKGKTKELLVFSKKKFPRLGSNQ